MKTYVLAELDIRKQEKVRKLNENLDDRSKEIEPSSTTDAEAIELMEITSKDIDTTVKGVEQDTSSIRELQGLDKELRTIKGALKVAIAKRVDLKARIEHEEKN